MLVRGGLLSLWAGGGHTGHTGGAVWKTLGQSVVIGSNVHISRDTRRVSRRALLGRSRELGALGLALAVLPGCGALAAAQESPAAPTPVPARVRFLTRDDAPTRRLVEEQVRAFGAETPTVR